MEKLNIKQQMAIEFKYLGKSYSDISQRIDVPIDTLKKWFREEGPLSNLYIQYAKEMMEARKENIEKKLYLNDDEIFTVSTNAVRVFAQQSLTPRQVPLRNKITGEIAYDKEGNPIMIDYRPNIKFGDVKKAIELQRLLRGLPTSYEKTEVTQTSLEEDVIIKELGLTEEDFKDENRITTAQRIADYLTSK